MQLTGLLRGRYSPMLQPFYLLVILTAAVGSSGCTAKEADVPFTRIAPRHLHPELVPPQTVVFEDERNLHEFWARYGSSPAPTIMFGKYVVAGIFLGERPNAGYGLKVTKILRKNGDTNIHYVEYLPDPQAGYIQMLVYPYEIISVPRPAGTITFSSEQRSR